MVISFVLGINVVFLCFWSPWGIPFFLASVGFLIVPSLCSIFHCSWLSSGLLLFLAFVRPFIVFISVEFCIIVGLRGLFIVYVLRAFHFSPLWAFHLLLASVELSIGLGFPNLLINDVGRTLLLGLPRKQNGCPIGYIMFLSVISPLKRRVQRL